MERLVGAITIAQILRHQNNWSRYLAWKKGLVRVAERYHVRRMLACRTPQLGVHIYHCEKCGIQRVVPHSCKSPFCSCCGKVRTDRWCEELLSQLLDVSYRHLAFTLPWQIRLPIKDNRKVMLNLLCRACADALFALTLGNPTPLGGTGRKRMEKVKPSKRYRPGLIIVIHTFGSDLKWNVHLHVIITCGGLSPDGTRWVDAPKRSLVSGPELGVEWKLRVIKAVAEAEEKGLLFKRRLRCDRRRRVNIPALLGNIRKKKWHVLVGPSLAEPDQTIKYCCRYTKRPVIGEQRITSYKNGYVTFRYKDYYNQARPAWKKLPVLEFIDRLVQHIPEKHYRYVRYYGILSSRTKKEDLPKARKLLHQEAQPSPEAETWEERRKKAGESAPLQCPICQAPMFLVAVLFGAPQFISQLLKIPLHHRIPSPCFINTYSEIVNLDLHNVVPDPRELGSKTKKTPIFSKRE